MPLFSNKFIARKTPLRKSISESTKDINLSKDSLENDSVIKLCLGNHEAVFEDGQWTTESGPNSNHVNKKLRKQIQSLQEENNLLQLKYNVLLDMLTQSTAENHLQQREIEKMKRSGK